MNLGVVHLAGKAGETAGKAAPVLAPTTGQTGRCTLRFVPSVGKGRKFHSSLAVGDRFIAAIVSAVETADRSPSY